MLVTFASPSRTGSLWAGSGLPALGSESDESGISAFDLKADIPRQRESVYS